MAKYKNWNQRVDVKRDNRLVGVKFIESHQFSKTTMFWELMSGTIHMNKGEYGERPTDKIVARFEMRLYPPYEMLMIELRPVANESTTHAAMAYVVPKEVSIDWVRERVVDTWMTYMPEEVS